MKRRRSVEYSFIPDSIGNNHPRMELGQSFTHMRETHVDTLLIVQLVDFSIEKTASHRSNHFRSVFKGTNLAVFARRYLGR